MTDRSPRTPPAPAKRLEAQWEVFKLSVAHCNYDFEAHVFGTLAHRTRNWLAEAAALLVPSEVEGLGPQHGDTK